MRSMREEAVEVGDENGEQTPERVALKVFQRRR